MCWDRMITLERDVRSQTEPEPLPAGPPEAEIAAQPREVVPPEPAYAGAA